MSWRIELRPLALAEIEDAAAWYESRCTGLGKRFVGEVSATIASLAETALLPRLRHKALGIRWVHPKRFPYRVIYRVEGERVVILAVLHAARRDAVWRERT